MEYNALRGAQATKDRYREQLILHVHVDRARYPDAAQK